MIDDLIELAFAHDLVRSVVQEADGRDAYVLCPARTDTGPLPPITVWVRPDGRFSLASRDHGLLSVGQVMARCGLSRPLRQRSAQKAAIVPSP